LAVLSVLISGIIIDFKAPALLTDDEIAEVLSLADELSKWAQDV
jgi:hypothetical protein